MKTNLNRSLFDHKGSFGHLLIVAGSKGMLGAAYLATKAALRSGVGKVTLATSSDVYQVMASHIPEAMSLILPTDKNGISARAVSLIKNYVRKNRISFLLIGPGLGLLSGTRDFVMKLALDNDASMLMDADALTAFSTSVQKLRKCKKPPIITPHGGEFNRLFGSLGLKGSRKEIAKLVSIQYHCILVLKGHHSIISNQNGKLAVNKTGNSGLASGGTGDVLSGMIAGLAAQGFESWLAARLGVWIHGRAADTLRRRIGMTALIASDLLQEIPRIMMTLEKHQDLRNLCQPE